MIEILNGTKETVCYHGNFDVHIYMNQEAVNYPLHWHTDIEIIMPIEEGYIVEVSDHTFHLEPRDILILAPGELHRLTAPEHGTRMILQLNTSLLFTVNGFDSVLNLLYPCLYVSPILDSKIHQQLSSTLETIIMEYFSDHVLREASVYSNLISLFVLIGRNCIPSESNFTNIKERKQLEYMDKFMHVCDYMNDHYMEGITADELANLSGFSKFHFSRLFKQFAGVTYYEYLNQRRVMCAEILLAQNNSPITEIAMQSGFNSLATFNRVFKNMKKCSPTEYRRLHSPTT